MYDFKLAVMMTQITLSQIAGGCNHAEGKLQKRSMSEVCCANIVYTSRTDPLLIDTSPWQQLAMLSLFVLNCA